MRILFYIALKQLLDRKRQSFVSLLGIVLGVAFFLAIASLMQGSERDFIRRLVDNSPHITISDEFREPRHQPVERKYADAVVELRNLRPMTETRGVRGYESILGYLRSLPGVRASAVLAGQALVSFAGKDIGVTLNGMVPDEMKDITTIEEHMIEGTVNDLVGYPDGIIIGSELAKKLSLSMGDNVTVAATTGEVRTFKIVGVFRTGRSTYDEIQTFVTLKRVQALLDRAQRINTIIVKLSDPYSAHDVAAQVEARSGYKSVSWQEASADIVNTLAIRNTIMYTVVSAVLIVAAFGIYNVISTVVLEKYRDIAILKSMGFYSSEVRRIFVVQGVILGVFGCLFGLPLGMGFMYLLMQIRFTPPGSSVPIQMPIDWSVPQFLIAAGFALCASILAAYLPARKAGSLRPVDILRGGAW